MNRKWLAGFTCCVLFLGLALLRAQSPAQSPSAGAAQAEAGAAQLEWVAEDTFEFPFTFPWGPDSEPAVPFLEPFPGDAVFFWSSESEGAFAFEGPEFSAGVLVAEAEPQGGHPAGHIMFERPIHHFVGPDPQDTITFVGFEAGLGNQVATGAPYSAQVTSEFAQTLADGNKIERKTTTTVYRDGQGRTRREQTLPAIGPYSASGEAPQAIFINDPVAGVNYVLDPARKVARKMSRPTIRLAPRPAPAGPQAGNPPEGNPQRPNRGGRDVNVTTESLGNQTIEGLFVQGTRITRTIPAGAVGNQQPVQITSERWYSPDLKLNLLVKNTDPMRGASTTTLTNIRRDEPPASLFQVPADYTVQEAGPRGMRMPPRVPQR